MTPVGWLSIAVGAAVALAGAAIRGGWRIWQRRKVRDALRRYQQAQDRQPPRPPSFS